MTLKSCLIEMLGRVAPAFLFPLLAIAQPAAAQGQVQGQIQGQIQGQPQQVRPAGVQPPAAMRPVPGALELSKMIWSTIVAVDQANQSGNYSVLRDMAAQGFQINNDPARLAQIFTGLRQSRVDLSNALLVPPTYFEAPRQVQADVFEVKGMFQMRPISIQFDLFYQWEQGRWKLFGVDIQPASMVTPPGLAPIAQPAPQPAPRRR